ncbi:MAG: hypothetical protein SGJ18_03040 [Pseudomonadota bacterium]|nr:hypothetical protein [Pseudomonadota bacterium]
MTKLLVVFGLIFFLGFWLANRNDFDKAINLTSGVESLIERSNQGELDLRGFKTELWDELVVLGAYSNICAYGLDGFEKGSSNCMPRLNEVYEYILFLRQNRVVGKADIKRRLVDLSTADLGLKRVKQIEAIFQYTTKGEWAAVKLKK